MARGAHEGIAGRDGGAGEGAEPSGDVTVLTGLRLGNFKAFGETQRMPIRPLTLIFGANSSGKSSLIHGLLLAHHAAETGELDVYFPKAGGTTVDLGGFRQFVRSRNTELKVHLEWEISRQSLTKRLLDLLPGVEAASIGLSIGLRGVDKSLLEMVGDHTPREIMAFFAKKAREEGNLAEAESLEVRLAETEDKLTLEEVSGLTSKLSVEGCWLNLNGQRLLSASVRQEGNLRLDLLDLDHKVVRFLVENLILVHSTTEHVDEGELRALRDSIDALVPRISFSANKFFPDKMVLEGRTSQSPRASFIPIRKEARLEDLGRVIENHLPSILEEVLLGVSDLIRQQLGKLSYLGPLRTYPPRHVGFSESNDPNWIAGGGSAWDTIKRNVPLREKVNGWLGDEEKLSTSYELRIQNLLTVESLKAKLVELSSKALAKYDEEPVDENGVARDIYGDIEEALHDIPERLQKLEALFSDIPDLVLYDKRSKTVVSHRDVGVGISQVLPVLVTSFAASGQLIALEQPEIHLHPALQAELGDVFIESALGKRKNTFLIETHSEHLILRILRRIRETTEGELKEGLTPITPQDVCVIYAKVGPNGGTVLTEIPVTPDGDFASKWPDGFFAERAKELF
jgi:predicted ATPase